MTTDVQGARDEVFGRILAAWTAAVAALALTDTAQRWQGKVEDAPGATTYWMRASMNGVNEEQSNLGKTLDGARRRTAIGNVFVQMFFPLSDADAWDKGLLLAKAMKNALAAQNPSGTVRLRNARINELTPDDKHHRLNVVADYEYDEMV